MITTATWISLTVTILAIETDRRTHFTYSSLPVVAFIGLLAVLFSL